MSRFWVFLKLSGVHLPARLPKATGSLRRLILCVLAEGLADIYPRLGPTSEWDIGAAQAVLEAAGGAVLTADGASLPYNSKENLLNPEFLAVSDGSFDWLAALPGFPDP